MLREAVKDVDVLFTSSLPDFACLLAYGLTEREVFFFPQTCRISTNSKFPVEIFIHWKFPLVNFSYKSMQSVVMQKRSHEVKEKMA